MTTERIRTARVKDEQVGHLMRKTVENGATPGEEVSAIQLAHMIVRQRGLDLDAFKAALAKIGDPPRYAITEDGFLVPAEAGRTKEAQGPGPHRRGDSDALHKGAGGGQAAADEACRASPTGFHRMEKYMRGTLATGVLYCLHCGIRR
jgi:hypothetical protein